MLAEISQVATCLTQLLELVSASRNLKNTNELSTKLAEIHDKLISAQIAALNSDNERALLSKRVRELETKLEELETFKSEKERYALHKLDSGMLVYAIKPMMQSCEPFHYA